MPNRKIAIILSFFLLILLSGIFFCKKKLYQKESSIPDIIEATVNLDIDNIDKEFTNKRLYYGRKLDKRLQTVLFHIYTDISNNEKEIKISAQITSEELEKLMYIIQFDCPELFNVDTLYNYTQKGNSITTLKPIYTMTSKDYKTKLDEIKKVTEEITEKIKNKSDYDKEVYIHDYILKNTEYDLTADNINNIYGCIIEGKANCKGYSNAFQYLLRLSGINCGIIIGEVKSGTDLIGHSWNIVEIEGKVYYSDICWDDIIDIDGTIDIDYHYAFFNMTYREMIKERNIYNQLKFLGNIPETKDDEHSYYKMNGLYASDYKKAEVIIKKKLPQILSSNKKILMIQCKNKDIYNKLNNNIADIIEKLIQDKAIHLQSCRYLKIDNGNTLIIYDFLK